MPVLQEWRVLTRIVKCVVSAMVIVIWFMLSNSHSQDTLTCEQKVQRLEKIIVIVKDERDRAQINISELWMRVEKLTSELEERKKMNSEEKK